MYWIMIRFYDLSIISLLLSLPHSSFLMCTAMGIKTRDSSAVFGWVGFQSCRGDFGVQPRQPYHSLGCSQLPGCGNGRKWRFFFAGIHSLDVVEICFFWNLPRYYLTCWTLHFHKNSSKKRFTQIYPTSTSRSQWKLWTRWDTVDGQNPAPPRMMIIPNYPIIHRVLTIPGGAGFRPSTVSTNAYKCF